MFIKKIKIPLNYHQIIKTIKMTILKIKYELYIKGTGSRGSE